MFKAKKNLETALYELAGLTIKLAEKYNPDDDSFIIRDALDIYNTISSVGRLLGSKYDVISIRLKTTYDLLERKYRDVLNNQRLQLTCKNKEIHDLKEELKILQEKADDSRISDPAGIKFTGCPDAKISICRLIRDFTGVSSDVAISTAEATTVTDLYPYSQDISVHEFFDKFQKEGADVTLIY